MKPDLERGWGQAKEVDEPRFREVLVESDIKAAIGARGHTIEPRSLRPDT